MNVRFMLILFYGFQAKQIDIHNLHPFYESDIFKTNNFVYDSERKVIMQTFPEYIED